MGGIEALQFAGSQLSAVDCLWNVGKGLTSVGPYVCPITVGLSRGGHSVPRTVYPVPLTYGTGWRTVFSLAVVVFRQQFFPGALIGSDAVNCCLHFVTRPTLSDPDRAAACLVSRVEDSNPISRTQFGIESEDQSSTQADVAGLGFLQEAVAPGVYAPNCEPEVNLGAQFPPAALASSRNAAESSPASA